ncbi:MAG TPA: phospholipase D-like domain-containing protein, partial [Gammaproteobacteria bacterium]
FIEQAQAGASLHCALYEIHFRPVLDALLAAKGRGVDVQVLYGATPGSSTTDTNNDALVQIGSPAFFKPRTKAKIAHNKFIVLSQGTGPKQVWTGSTNLSNNAFYGQLNVGHALKNATVARKFKKLWDELAADPETGPLRARIEAIAPLDAASTLPHQVIFSPYKGLAVYDYYVALAKSATAAVFMTYPFGMSKEFRAAYDANDGVLRYALLDKYVNGGNAASRKAATDDTIRIRKHPNVGMALGERVFTDDVDGWRKERSPIGVNVNWVHTKFMVIDPLSSSPTVVSGSANWSEPSTNQNDENMLVIRDDARVADIFFGEFMRVFAHHRFREALARHLEQFGNADTWKPSELKTKPADWVPKHYDVGGEYEIRRRYFVS